MISLYILTPYVPISSHHIISLYILTPYKPISSYRCIFWHPHNQAPSERPLPRDQNHEHRKKSVNPVPDAQLVHEPQVRHVCQRDLYAVQRDQCIVERDLYAVKRDLDISSNRPEYREKNRSWHICLMRNWCTNRMYVPYVQRDLYIVERFLSIET